MQKHIQMLLTMVLAFAIILSMATGVLATEEDHIHSWQYSWSDDSFHCMVCSDCGEESIITHSNNSAGICTICGHTPHEHIWQYNDGQNYDYNHGLRCTQCAATSIEDHIYGNDGKCTVCGNTPPHVHQWEWDGNKSNHVWDHIVVCSCGAEKTERHQLYAWDGKIGSDRWHRELCGICGFALLFDHLYDSAYFNGERCTVCGYPAQGATEPGVNPGETTPVETTPTETRPEETIPVETMPSGTEPDETIPTNVTKEDSQRSSFVWVWVAAILVFAGGLGTVVFFVKKKSS